MHAPLCSIAYSVPHGWIARSAHAPLDYAHSVGLIDERTHPIWGPSTPVEGISSRVLTERLRLLEQKGFIYRDYEPTIPPSVTYGITKRMKDIQKVLGELDQLARKWQQEDVPAAHKGRNQSAGEAVSSS